MAISKKQARQIAYLVNSITVWNTAAKEAVMQGKPSRQYMNWHDQYAEELNNLLGLPAVSLYNIDMD